MSKEQESSPKGKLQRQQHQEIIIRDKITNDTKEITIYKPARKLPQNNKDQVQVQEDALSDIELFIPSRRKRPQHQNPSHSLSLHGGNSEHVKPIPVVSDPEKQSDQSKSSKELKQTTCWEFGDRYSKKAKSGPDFGPPVVSSKSKPKKCMIGGPIPVNKLKNNDSERRMLKNPRSPPSMLSLSTHERRSWREDQSNKRRRLDAGLSQRPVIDNEESRRINPRDVDRLQFSRGGISQNKSLHHPVPELWKVDEIMRIKKKSRSRNLKSSLDVQSLHSPKSKKFLLELRPEKRFASQRSNISTDPMEDEVGQLEIISSITTSPKRTEKCTDESRSHQSVASLPISTKSQKPNLHRRFSQEDIQVWNRNSGLEISNTPRSDSSPTKRYKENLNTNISTILFNPDESLDEISISHYNEGFEITRAHKTLPDDVKQRKRKFRGSSYADHFDLDWSSDDVRVNSKVGSSPFSFKRTGSSKKSIEQAYSVLQVFCNSKQWLSLCQSSNTDSKRTWTLLLNTRKRSLAIFDENNELVPGLDLGRVNSVQGSCDHGKMIISKPSSARDAIGGHRICLELKNSDESQCFISRLRKCDPNVEVIFNEQRHHLEKVFEHTLKTAESSMAKSNILRTKSTSKSCVQGAEDLKFLKLKANKRKNNYSSKTTVVQSPSSELKGLSKSMMTRSQRGSTDNKSMNKPSTLIPDSPQSPNEVCEYQKIAASLDPSRSDKIDSSSNYNTRQNTPEPEKWTRSNPTWSELWHKSIVYPAEGKNKATVDRADIERLDEGEFLNDNLMMFYLRWLQHKTEEKYPEIAERVYFHNTFFYERLTKRGRSGIYYENVERWTSKVNLLGYDYIVVPVNENYHWYVAIICNAPKLLDKSQTSSTHLGSLKYSQNIKLDVQKVSDTVTCLMDSSIPGRQHITGYEVNTKMREMNLSDQIEQGCDSDSDPVLLENSDNESSLVAKIGNCKKIMLQSSNTKCHKQNSVETRIITLDSFGQSHSLTCTNLKRYLLKEIESKLKIKVDDPGNLGRTAKNIPQQDNFFDCGLFVLGYVEIFLRDPDAFISSLLQNKFPDDVSWPKPSEMRSKIRSLLFTLQNEHEESVLKRKQENANIRHTNRPRNAAKESSTLSHEKLEIQKTSPEQICLNTNDKAYTKSQSKSQIKCLSCQKDIMPNLDRESNAEIMDHTTAVSTTEKEQPTGDVSETLSKEFSATDTNESIPETSSVNKTRQANSNPCNYSLLEKKCKILKDDDTSVATSLPCSSMLPCLKSSEKIKHVDNQERILVSSSKYFRSPPLSTSLHRLQATIRQTLSDIALKEDNTSIYNDLDEANHEPLSAIADCHEQDHASQRLEEVLNQNSLLSNPIITSTRKPLLSPVKIKSATESIFEESDPPSPIESEKIRENNQPEFGDRSAGKRRRMDQDSIHRKGLELSSTSWKRDGVEKALIRTISKSSPGVSDKDNGEAGKNASPIIIIE